MLLSENMRMAVDDVEKYMESMPFKQVYVSHPYKNKLENALAIRELIKTLTLKHLRGGDSNILFISPVLLYSHMYNDTSYEYGLWMCLEILKNCDCIIMAGDWKHSRGCMAEYYYCKSNNIPIYMIEDILDESK